MLGPDRNKSRIDRDHREENARETERVLPTLRMAVTSKKL